MKMNWNKATKQQLLTIISEDCPINFKYKAAFELRRRKEIEVSQRVSRLKRVAAFSDKQYTFYS